jgi:hypothetical protein
MPRFFPYLFFVVACDEPSDSELYDPYIDGRHCDESPSLTWESFGQPFFMDHCVGCHSSQLVGEFARGDAVEGVDFDTLDGVRKQMQRIYERSADDNNTMPVMDSVADTERWLLGDWLACGAP